MDRLKLGVLFGGASEDAIRVGGKHADAYAFWGEPLDGIRQRIAEDNALDVRLYRFAQELEARRPG